MNSAVDRLPLSTKLAYGSGDLGTTIVAALTAIFLFDFFTNVALLTPGAAGALIIIVKVWGAFNAPFIGWLSDRTTSRWGRRRPWLLFGALPFGFLFFLMWMTPPFGGVGFYLYYLVIGLLLDTAFASVSVPFAALTPELTHDYDERTSLTSFRASFAFLGAMAAFSLYPWLAAQFADPATGYLIVAAFWAILCTAPSLVVFFFTREPQANTTGASGILLMPLAQQLRIVFANRPYRFVIAIHLCSWLALQLIISVTGYYVTSFLRRPELLPIMLLVPLVAILIFLFVWSAVSRWLDKRDVYLIGAAIWLAALLVIFYLAPEQTDWLLPLTILAAAGCAATQLIPWAMMPDVIEFDEWESGQRREGLFYGLLISIQKSCGALGVGLMGMMLAWAGYIPPSEAASIPLQPESALFTIRLFIGPIPATILACSLVVAYHYPVSRSVHTRLLTALEQRRAGMQSGQPFTTRFRGAP